MSGCLIHDRPDGSCVRCLRLQVRSLELERDRYRRSMEATATAADGAGLPAFAKRIRQVLAAMLEAHR